MTRLFDILLFSLILAYTPVDAFQHDDFEVPQPFTGITFATTSDPKLDTVRTSMDYVIGAAPNPTPKPKNTSLLYDFITWLGYEDPDRIHVEVRNSRFETTTDYISTVRNPHIHPFVVISIIFNVAAVVLMVVVCFLFCVHYCCCPTNRQIDALREHEFYETMV